LPMPVGFKNATDGDVQVAADACRAAASGHTFLGITAVGTIGLVTSHGNPDCHVVLRGGRGGPNFGSPSVASALTVIEGAGLPRRVVIDAAHGNSGKDHRRQPEVALAVAAQVAEGERVIAGVMLESFLVAGRQEPGALAGLVYGQSVTDPCMDFATTQSLLESLGEAVRQRRLGGSQ
jgi:3-deoxy-7-phosphoheptulonate synthase